MATSVYRRIIDTISKKISLFETPEEVDEFLKETIAELMEPADASLGAVFVYDNNSGDLIFRVGYDKEGYWDNLRFGKEGGPCRFSLDGNEVGKAFLESRISYISYENAEDHPFRSKVVIPILRGPEKVGIFMMAHQDKDAFRGLDGEEMTQAVSVLGDMLAEAMVFVNYETPAAVPAEPESFTISGLTASGGIARGEALPIWIDMESAAQLLDPAGTTTEELALFERALAGSISQLEKLQDAAAEDSEMVALIFTAQMLMLKDKSFTNKMRDLIVEGRAAQEAVRSIIGEYADRFSGMSLSRLAEKAQDVRDLGLRIITNMGRGHAGEFSYEGRIVLSRHVYPSDLYRLALEKAAGVVLQGAGITAHISILARSLELPVLITDDKSLQMVKEGTPVILDADSGILYVNPGSSASAAVIEKPFAEKQTEKEPACGGKTADDVAVQVAANINILKDAKEAVNQGAEGIGLYRSEFPFILKNDFLSEEQQFRIYSSIVKSQPQKSVILRTADIGGDKLLKGRGNAENNPFLGVRGIRFSLANRDMFRDQLRAMLRAGSDADLGIMLPMVSDVEEVLQAKAEINVCLGQLAARNLPHNKNPKIGAMIELPSAAMSAAELADETDFLSIGTNDLIMYLLAVDRTNENLSHLYRSHHPTVLRVISNIARDIGEKITQLSICGDAASDPVLIPVLIGLGIRKFSVSPSAIKAVKQQIARFTVSEMEHISREMLSIKRIDEMEAFVGTYQKRFLSA